MSTQLEGLSTGEIQALISEARDILAHRESEEKRLVWGREHAEAGEGGRWLEHELINCGNCPRCKAGGRHHGPYWYLYRYTGSKMVSSYVGRRLTGEVARSLQREDLADLRPEAAFPESYPEMVSKEM